MKLNKLIAAAAIAAACTTAAQAAKPLVIAHRGHWNVEGSAQNSIRSLVKADSIGCFASEFDVWMTPDSVVVVNHDPTINGYRIEDTPSEIILAQKLTNGETVSTLEQYLQAATGLKTRLVCELKTHDSRSREKAAIHNILDLMKKYNLEDRVDYITFSRDGVKQLIKEAPAPAEVYYLSGDYVPAQVKYMKATGVDYQLKVLKKHPEWIQQFHDRGLKVNVWTVDDPADMQWCIDHNVDFITTNNSEVLIKMLAD